MAWNDWNGDGKKDTMDDLIEYQIYKNMKKNKDEPQYTYSSRKGGVSNFAAVSATILGFILVAFEYMLFNIDPSDVPVLVTVILWGVNCSVLAFFWINWVCKYCAQIDDKPGCAVIKWHSLYCFIQRISHL